MLSRRFATMAYCGGWCWRRGVCCAATRSATAAWIPWRPSACSAAATRADELPPDRQSRPAADRRVRRRARVLPRLGRALLGLLDHRADHRGPHRADPADAQAVQVHAGPAAPLARDQGPAGQVQGRPSAPEPGDDEVLPGEQGQPVRVMPAPGAAAPGLLLALLHAP